MGKSVLGVIMVFLYSIGITSIVMYKIKKPLPLLQETKANNLCGTTLVPPCQAALEML
jgi:glycopeptide antibiotics resistance protein